MHPKVLLLMESSSKRDLYANTLPPLGLLSIAAYLREKGIGADVLDRNVPPQREISFSEYDIFGLSLNVSNIENSLSAIKSIKSHNRDAKVIVGGPFCNCYPEKLIGMDEIDAVAVGESEETFFEYVTCDDKAKIKGLYLNNGAGAAFFTGERELIKELDRLPFPALDMVRLEDYDVPISKRKPISALITSRGCPFGCTFCYHHFGKKWRARSAESVIDEIQWQVESLGAKEICIVDDNFTLDVSRCERIFRGILERDIKVKFQFLNGIRIDNLSFELLRLFRDAGVWLISLAPESGDAFTIDKIGKKVELDRFYEVVRWCRLLDIATFGFYMLGFPWETPVSARKTMDYILKLDTDFMQVSNVELYPKTELYVRYGQPPSDDIFQDRALFSNQETVEFSRLRKKIYRRFYLNPRKILNLLRICPFPSLLRLSRYALLTKNL